MTLVEETKISETRSQWPPFGRLHSTPAGRRRGHILQTTYDPPDPHALLNIHDISCVRDVVVERGNQDVGHRHDGEVDIVLASRDFLPIREQHPLLKGL